MMPIFQYSQRSRFIHFCILSAIICLSSAKFHGWILNQRHKTRYLNANNPFATSLFYHPPLPHPHPGRHWPLIASRRNFRDHTITRTPVDFSKMRQATYHHHSNKRPASVVKTPHSSICKKAGYFPYPNDCKRFYRCVKTDRIVSEAFSAASHFNIFHFACPPGTIFDQRISVCNHPRVAKCDENNDDDEVDNEISSGVNGPDNTGFGSVIPVDSGHNSALSQIAAAGIQEVPNTTESENLQLQDLIDNVIESAGNAETDSENSNEAPETSDKETSLDNGNLQSTTASMESVAIIITENPPISESPEESEGTSATVIMDGFVIEKPEKEENINSNHSIGTSEGMDTASSFPGGTMTTPVPSIPISVQTTQTESGSMDSEINEQDTVFTSPSNQPNIPNSTGTSISSDTMSDNALDDNISTGSVTDQNFGEVGTLNPFIESTETTMIIVEDIIEDVSLSIGTEIDTQGTPAFLTTTESTIPTSSTPNESGSQDSSSIQDLISNDDDQSSSSSINSVDNNSDSSNQVTEGLDSNMVIDNNPSIDGVNIIPGVIQTISSQINVSDENNDDVDSTNSNNSESIPINMIDGFDIGGSSMEEDPDDSESTIDQGEMIDSSNDSAIDIVMTGDGSNNDDNNFVVTDEDIKYTVQSGSLYNCTKPGYFPYELNCVEFYVCIEVEPNVLSALQLHRCPRRYLFDDKTKRCQKEEKVTCNRPNITTTVSTKSSENVIVVPEEFVDSFFNISLTYNRQQV